MKTITPNQRLQLIGLLTVAAMQSRQLAETEHAVADLVGVPPDNPENGWNSSFGHVSDAIYDDGRRDADSLLRRLDIAVEGGA